MVTVTGFNERQRKDGTTFIALDITGGVELIQSSTTGRYYATVRKCSIPSTFSKQVAESIIGQRLPGEIVKVICEPYQFTNSRTGEVLTLYKMFPQFQGALQGEYERRKRELIITAPTDEAKHLSTTKTYTNGTV